MAATYATWTIAHDERLTEAAKKRSPSLLGWAGPAYEQAALPSLSLLKCRFPVVVLREDCMFNSNKLSETGQLPAVVHAFSTNKLRFSQKLDALAERGMEPVLCSVLGCTGRPPLWQAAVGFDFAVGNSFKTRGPRGLLTSHQRAVLRLLWKRGPAHTPRFGAVWTDQTADIASPPGSMFLAHSILADRTVQRMRQMYDSLICQVQDRPQPPGDFLDPDQQGLVTEVLSRRVSSAIQGDGEWSKLGLTSEIRLHCTGLG